MPVDQDRYREFASALRDLQKGLSAPSFMEAVQDKLIDYLAKNNVDPRETTHIRRLVQGLFGDEFQPFARQIFQTYADVVQTVNTLYSDLGVSLTRDAARIRAIETANAAELGDYEDSVVQGITRQIREGLVKHENVEQLAKRINKVGDKATVYARTIAQTQIKVYGRALKHEKANIAEVPFYEYVGLFRDTNRAFCRALIGTTHHIDVIRQMRNGNKEPVIHNCGGWRCIHDWEPDPFATKGTEGKFYAVEAQSMKMKVFGDENTRKRMEAAQNESRFRDLSDPEAYIEKGRTIPVSAARIRHVRNFHPKQYPTDESVAQAIDRVRSKPDSVFYQFHEERSTAVFERSGELVFATDKEVRALFKPSDWNKYYENVAQYWKEVNR